MKHTICNHTPWILALLLILAVPASAQITAVRVGGTPLYEKPIVGDVNGDGLDDIVAVEIASGDGKVYINQGDGAPGVPPTFVATAQTLPSTPVGSDLGDLVGRLADIDGDGDLDLFAVPLPYFNDGTGVFTVSTQTPLTGGNGFVPGMDLEDLDNDGDLDAVSFGGGTGPYIYENDGNGVFTLVYTVTGVSPDNGWTQALVVDINGDPYLDIVTAGKRNSDLYVLLNDGSNGFSIFLQTPRDATGSGTNAADMDGDGDVDVVQGLRTFFNDGAASPTFTEVASTASMAIFARLYDLDLDGFPDQVADNLTYFNDGTGLLTTTDSVAYSSGTGATWTDIGDLIGDDLPELVSTYSANGGNIIMFSGIILPPELSVDPLIPGAELETVDIDVDLATNSSSVAATTFSIDYDETCLSFDDTDGDADNIPDAMTFHTPADFGLTVFHDLGDADGEIDISITDLAPPIATLGDGALVTITFTATCEPAIDATITAPVVFSADPAATFGDDLGGDVAGATSDGSVEIWPGPRGDCNRNDAISAADLIGEALEIFDGDGTFWADVVDNVPFAGSPVGCDANDDAAVDAGDISCTILLIFGGSCGSPFADPAGLTFDSGTSPVLGLERAYRGADGRLWMPVMFSAGSHAISSLAFSLDLAEGLAFDPFDGDGDGVADAVRFADGRPGLVEVRYDATDRGGELDLAFGQFGDTFASGLLLEIAVEPRHLGSLQAQAKPARFATSPSPSFGDLSGRAVPGRALTQTLGYDGK